MRAEAGAAEARAMASSKNMEEEKNKSSTAASTSGISSCRSVSILLACLVHLICGLGLAVSLWVAHNLYSVNLVSDPSDTLLLIWTVETPIVVLLYSWFRLNPKKCSTDTYQRPLIGLFLCHYSQPNGSLEYMICMPAHGAVIAAWFGAWPMPLDWERPWQEWPICVTYGAMIGYLVGMLVSLGFVLARSGQQHPKGD
ncbi:phosphatidylinositol-glycan biosynthesis, class f, putative [Ricinus communis]|uniref:Phosphatidylinositol-glycan biosynthesis, class f, putative n=1 Tax=Ricinus communis TaxID=3988 RepID=B9RGP0_RICCO|nr:phosphatidylinositol-glycan biosynthesis, class f, putative [Ricinus communis]